MGAEKTVVRKKRVLLVVRWPVGGIRTFLRYVYSRFDSQIWQFTILVPCHDENEALADDLKGQDVKFIFTSAYPSPFSFGFSVFRELSRRKYDLVHSQGFTSAICAALPCVVLFRKHLVTSHDVLNNEQFVGTKGYLKRLGLNLTLRSACLVHSVSHDAQANLLSFLPGLEKERCLVIQNGIETKRFISATAKKLRTESGDEGAFLIGFFGRFMGQKGFRYLVDAVEILSEDNSL